METNSQSPSEPTRSTLSRTVVPIQKSVIRVVQWTTSSVWRFLIALGIVLIVVGAVRWDGVMAAHLGIYGGTALILGVLGRLFVRRKIKSS